MIRVVLYEPQELANIALVVRAMKNFGVGELCLVAPRDYDPYRIEGIAHRTRDVLERVRTFAGLAPALADCVHVVGFSARGRTAKRNVQRPREAAAEVLELAEAGPVALLFGREDTGLSNAALDECHRVVTIPTRPDYPSLNLGQAVALMLYELALAGGAETTPLKPPRREAPAAPAALLEQLFVDVERTLATIGFFKRRRRELILRTVRELVHRAPLDSREAMLLRAMAIEAAEWAGRARCSTGGEVLRFGSDMTPDARQLLLDEAALERTLQRMAQDILRQTSDPSLLVLIGVQRRGVELASRLAVRLAAAGHDVPRGAVDTTLYRDDLEVVGPKPLVGPTGLPVDLGGRDAVEVVRGARVPA